MHNYIFNIKYINICWKVSFIFLKYVPFLLVSVKKYFPNFKCLSLFDSASDFERPLCAFD